MDMEEMNFYEEYNIDVNRLSRDFIKEPLKYIQDGSVRYRERPKKEDIEYLYIEKNLGVAILAKYYNYSVSVMCRKISELGIKKDRKLVYEVQKRTLLKTCGVENPFQKEDVKKKIEQTNLRKYGKKSFVQTEEYKIKNIKTREERYGEDLFCRNKYRETCLKKYGVENTSQANFTDEQKRFINDKEYTEKYIKENKILNASDFSEMTGIKLFASLTLLHKHDLIGLFDYTTSSQERELQELLTSWGIEYKRHYRIDNKEIDIYIPTLKLGIEFNGSWWHSEVHRKENYHYNKSILAEQHGIFIYHIFEYDWNSIKEKVINQLKNLLQINEVKIYARKCIIKEVDKKVKKEFLEQNHMQGNDNCNTMYGLYYRDELVSLMTFSKPHNNKKYEWELSRFCSKSGCNVIGGADKLLQHFIKEKCPNNIISYSDIAHTRGTLYKTLGFELSHISSPSYVWIKSDSVLSRYQTRVSVLKKYNFEGNSETEIMHNLGYVRVYNCGNKVWIWKK